MISFLLASAGFLNLMFYVFAIGCAISFVLEQFVKDNERNLYIVQTNRKYCWRQAWITNACWFLCNVGLYIMSRNVVRKYEEVHRNILNDFIKGK